jgi:hypothetical protein
VQSILAVAGLALTVWFLYRLGKDLDAAVRKRVLRWLRVPLVLLLLILGLRFGAAWLPLLAAGGWALLKHLFPLLLRVAPLAWMKWGRGASQRTGFGREGADDRLAARGNMTRSEALEVLGLNEGASKTEIIEAYKRLVQRVHPDKPGGSDYMTRKLNQAKSVLLT